MQTPLGFFVEVSVTIDGVEKSQIHPILDNTNKPIKTPNPFQINTSIQRALVKAIALHGLGLYVYAGEDLPTGAEPPLCTDKDEKRYNTLIANEDGLGLFLFLHTLTEDARTELHNSFPTGKKTAMKEKASTLEAQGADIFNNILDALSGGDTGLLAESIDGMAENTKHLLWRRLNDVEQATLKEMIAMLNAD